MVNILILTYNAEKYTKRCIETVFSDTQEEFRLLVVDNASEDGVFKWVEGLNPKGKCVDVWVKRNDSNLGFSAGMNVLFRKVRESYDGDVVLLNPDATTTPGWVTNMRGPFNKIQRVGITTPSLMSGCYNSTVWKRTSLTWPSPTKLEGFTELAWACFACVMIFRQCFDECGDLNQEFWHYGSDEDYGRRVRGKGYRIFHTKESVVNHVGQRCFVELAKRHEDVALERIGKVWVDELRSRGLI